MQVGAHVSSAGGLWTSIARATAIEAEAIQVFPSAPQAWRQTKHTPEALERFRREREQAGIGEVWMHSTYLVNLATDNPEQLEKSIDAVANSLRVAEQAGALGLVLHTGSHKGEGLETYLDQIASAITEAFERAPGTPVLALENAAGHGGVIGRTFEELGAILKAVGHPRLKVCVDTCHAFAAGYDLASRDGAHAMLEEFDHELGLAQLVVWHLNDSKLGLGELRDRHENIGDGRIGTEGFQAWLEAVSGVDEIPAHAMLLEVPGFDDKGPDLENVRRAKAFREAVESVASR